MLQDDVLARLLTFPNVLITPRQAYLTREALGDIAPGEGGERAAVGSGEPLAEGTEL